jgi:tetratricopeptide (TPR) repeat protein
VTALASVEARRDLFRQHVLRSGDFALRYSRERQHDDEALNRQRENILQAMDACHRYADADQIVVDIALTLHGHMERQGYWETWEGYLERAVEAGRRLGDPRAKGTLLNDLGEIHRGRGRWRSALALHEEALGIFDCLEDEAGIAESHQHLGCLWWLRGRWERASTHFEIALKITEGADKRGADLASLYRDIGTLCSYKGAWKRALGYLREGARIAGQLGDTCARVRACSSMGYAHWRRGEWTKARSVLQWAIETAEDRGYETRLAIACNNLAAVLLSQGEWKRALAYLKRDLSIVEPIGAVHLAAHAYDDVGEAYRQARRWEEAWRELERSAEIKQRLDDLSGLAATYHHMGLLCTDMGEHERAVAYHRRALALREQLRGGQDVAEMLVSLAWAYYDLGGGGSDAQDGSNGGRGPAGDEMDTFVERGRTLASQLDRRDLLTRLLWLEAEVALTEGRAGEAHEIYERALEISRPVGPWRDNDRLIALHRETEARLEILKDRG